MSKPNIQIIAAIGKNRVLGKDTALLWHIPDDLKRFKQLTLGHPVIMGRKTFESIVKSLGKALPGRTNIVITRDMDWTHEGVIVCHSIEEALAKAKEIDLDEVFIGGGAQIYKEALPFVNHLHLTLIEDEKEGDAFFPAYEQEFTTVLKEESRECEGLRYRFVDLER